VRTIFITRQPQRCSEEMATHPRMEQDAVEAKNDSVVVEIELDLSNSGTNKYNKHVAICDV
jgi:hypothetical protein